MLIVETIGRACVDLLRARMIPLSPIHVITQIEEDPICGSMTLSLCLRLERVPAALCRAQAPANVLHRSP